MGGIGLNFGKVGLGSAAGALLVFAATAAWTAEPPPVPDLTREKPPLRQHDYNLGPTGARGWIWGWNLSTANARQILITQVDSGSPADGLLEPGDVLLGLNGVPFATDARRAFGEAITEAEREENEGRLRLLRWRRGRTDDLVLKLRPLGTYSNSAPRNCPKTARIVAGACRHLAGTRLQNDVPGQINALGLLATGRPEHHAQVARLAREIGPADLSLKLVPGMVAWPWGTANLLLTEYHLATGDASVLPAIREYSTKIAEGQSSVGTWGHGMVLPGSTRGLGGYGAVNQAGLGCWLSLILAERCGVEDAGVRQAIERSRRFFSFFIGKGSIPYGDHGPYHLLHDNNGKNGQAAIAFDLLQDDVGRRFFSRMATAAHAERELGHTGNYFGYLWGPLAAARAGLEAVAAHLEPQALVLRSRPPLGWELPLSGGTRGGRLLLGMGHDRQFPAHGVVATEGVVDHGQGIEARRRTRRPGTRPRDRRWRRLRSLARARLSRRQGDGRPPRPARQLVARGAVSGSPRTGRQAG